MAALLNLFAFVQSCIIRDKKHILDAQDIIKSWELHRIDAFLRFSVDRVFSDIFREIITQTSCYSAHE